MPARVLNNLSTTILSILDAPWYHLILEICLVLWVIWLIRKKKKTEKADIVLTPEEEEEIIREWRPQALVDDMLEEDEELINYQSTAWASVEGRPGKYITVEGKKYLNLATHNYLGFVEDESVIQEAENCIRRYGVGSCGPRGFYGTFDVHLKLEEKIAEFMSLEETALYSYGFATISSAIPSYAKKGDIIFVDEEVNFAIQKGLQASRSTIVYFRHNDYNHLEDLLDQQAKRDSKNPRKAKSQRRFCVVEGIYQKTGTICPLVQVNQLCLKHKVRLFVDESISLGALGNTGRGITEHFNVPVQDIDFIAGTMEYAFASFGGFIVGSSYVVDHQRISGLGYCFSASLPPFLAGAGMKAVEVLMENPNIVQELQTNSEYMHNVLMDLKGFELSGDPLSPIKFLTLRHSTGSRLEDHQLLDQIIIHVKDNFGIAIVQPAILENQEHRVPPPSLRVSVNRLLSKEEMNQVKLGLDSANDSLLQNLFGDGEGHGAEDCSGMESY